MVALKSSVAVPEKYDTESFVDEVNAFSMGDNGRVNFSDAAAVMKHLLSLR